jgi:hypothetical protein
MLAVAPAQKLASSFSYFTSRYAPAIITLLVLSAGFYFYFNVVVSDNEADLKQRNFRGLHRMATNISGKVDDYAERNAVNFLEALSPSDEVIPKRSNQIKSDSTLRVQARVAADYDLKDTLLSNKTDTQQKFAIKFFNEWNFLFRGNGDTAAYTSVKNFTSLLLRRDLFPYYLLAKEDTILFDELNISHQTVSKFLPGGYARDSVKKGQIQSGESREVNIGGRAYKLFLLPFVVQGNKEFTIGGYMPLESYVSEQRYIPTYAILWMVNGLMVVILMFPLLKVFLMHRSEQLLVSNAISSLASLHVIAAIIVLIVINSYVYFNLILSSADNNLTKLADSTASNFTAELDAALGEIESSKTLMKEERNQRDVVIPLQNLRDSGFANQQNRKVSTTYKPGSVYPYFKHIAWVDASGQQQFRWTTNSYIPKKVDVSDRDYFKAVKSGNLWLKNGKPYYLTGVSSWVSNEKLAVISVPFFAGDTASKKAKGLMMVSLSAPFRSMFNAIVPEGYGFCIVKDNGDVLFHIDKNRSLNENLVEECSDNGSLQSLLRTRSPGFSSSRYSGSSQRFYIQPIAGMPFSVVSYRDMRTIWAEDLDVISACSILCLMNLAVILIAILIIQASGYKRSLLHSQSILFTWLRPEQRSLYHPTGKYKAMY